MISIEKIYSPFFLALFLMIVLNVCASLVLRQAGTSPVESKFLFGVLGWMGIGGFALFGISGLLYAVILTKIPLILTQSVAALQFIGIVFASRFVLGEPVSTMKWLGISLIFLGILFVSFESE